MIKYICDKCGKETDDIIIMETYLDDYHLCDDCWEKFKKWMEVEE